MEHFIRPGYSPEQISDRLRFDNPWWSTGKVDPYYGAMSPRMYLDEFYSHISDAELHRGIILMGQRRVGKTVLLFHTIQRLLESGVNPHKIIYISIETPIYSCIALEELFSIAKEAVGAQGAGEKFYVFFDEIQYLKDWEVHLKSLVDSFRTCKFVASGSAAAALKMKSDESGAGRFTDFYLPPLAFCEYLQLKGLTNIIVPSKETLCGAGTQFFRSVNLNELNQHFIDYINFGGYPEVVLSERIRSNPAQFIRNDIIDKVLLRDLPSLYGISDVQELNAFFSVIAYHSGNEFSYEGLAQLSGVKKETLHKYLEYLQAAFLLKTVYKTDRSARRFQRITSFKVYLTNPSLRCALFQPLFPSDEKIGSLVETAVLSQRFPRSGTPIYYSNWKEGKTAGEVDMVGLNPATQKPQWASEIKWTNRFYERPGELKSLRQFMDANKLQWALVTTLDAFGTREVDGKNFQCVPTALYAYTLGYNTLARKESEIGL